QIFTDIEAKQSPGRPKRKIWQRPAFWAMTFAAAVLLSLGLLRTADHQSHTRGDQRGFVMAQHDEIPTETVAESSDTDRLRIIPVTSDADMIGDVWLNEATNEMVLRVDGLTPLKTNDYQLWLIHQNNDWNGELLNLRDGS